MKPCFFKRKRIAWLAIDALEPRQATELSSHLETCEGCRQYLREIYAVTRSLKTGQLATEAELVIPSKHHKLAGVLHPLRMPSPWETLFAPLPGRGANWKAVLAALGSIAVIVLILSVTSRHAGAPPATPPLRSGIVRPDPAAVAPTFNPDLSPTVANYLLVANRSLDQFDDLLTKQAHRPPPSTAVYTASMLAMVNASD